MSLFESTIPHNSNNHYITVMFDFNVWQRLILDEKEQDRSLTIIKKAIELGTIKPFLCDACYIEALPKKDRLKILAQYGELSFRANYNDTTININISPNTTVYETPRELSFKFELAKNLGFKAISTCRIAMPHAKLFDLHLPSEEEFLLIQERMDEILHFIRNVIKAGDTAIRLTTQEIRDKLGLQHLNWLQSLKYLDASEANKTQKALAELADGDVVVSCYSYKFDYLCTNDNGGGNSNSVFSTHNKEKLSNRFKIKFLSSQNLSELVKPF